MHQVLPDRAHVGIKEFKEINWLPSRQRFEQMVCVNILKFLNNSSPEYTKEIYQTADETHFTRRSLYKLHPPKRRTNKGQKCVSYIGPKLWNKLPNELKTIKNVNTFKQKISFSKSCRKSKKIHPYITNHIRKNKLNIFI